jgi:bifunctional non-homologous end joining protein LigD
VRQRRFITRTEPPREPEGFILPCIPTFAHVPPKGPQWVYEIKHDGYRFQCRRAGERLHVYSRWGVDWAAHVPDLVETMSALPARSLTIDGEGVAYGPDGIPNFERLRLAVARKGALGA